MVKRKGGDEGEGEGRPLRNRHVRSKYPLWSPQLTRRRVGRGASYGKKGRERNTGELKNKKRSGRKEI